MITIEQAKNLKHGDILHHNIHRNSDGSCQRWKVNGVVKRWKREPDRIQIPVKHGLRSYDYIRNEHLGIVHLEYDCLNEKK